MSARHPSQDAVVFFGTDAFSLPSLIRLLSGGWNVVGVVTKPDARTGRGRQLTAPAVKRLADAREIPVFQPTSLASIESELRMLDAKIGVVVAYGKIIPASMLELFPLGLVNVHASLLPKYRGASPIEAAILNGEPETGVTLMQLEAGLDTGPTYDTATLQLDGTENRIDLYERLAEMGADLLEARLGAILEEQVVPIPQDHGAAITVGRISKSDGAIDWSKSAETLDREIRAYLGWPGSRTRFAGTDVTITAAHTSPESGPAGVAYKTADGELAVSTGDGSLIIDALRPAGKRDMSGRDFLAGHSL